MTDTHVAWRTKRGVPQMPSPVLVDAHLYWVNDNGIVVCVEAKTGKEVWRERIGGSFAASLLSAGERLYCFDRSGKATVASA